MTSHEKKGKLTLSIDRAIRDNTKRLAYQKRIPLSRLVEKYLDFFSNPIFYCFKCGVKFSSTQAELCLKCGWMVCPDCSRCRCGLNEEVVIALFHMRRVYEDLLGGKVK